jgi:hypothetical protein
MEEAYGRGFLTKEFQQFLRYLSISQGVFRWYFRSSHILPTQVVSHRLKIL